MGVSDQRLTKVTGSKFQLFFFFRLQGDPNGKSCGLGRIYVTKFYLSTEEQSVT